GRLRLQKRQDMAGRGEGQGPAHARLAARQRELEAADRAVAHALGVRERGAQVRRFGLAVDGERRLSAGVPNERGRETSALPELLTFSVRRSRSPTSYQTVAPRPGWPSSASRGLPVKRQNASFTSYMVAVSGSEITTAVALWRSSSSSRRSVSASRASGRCA